MAVQGPKVGSSAKAETGKSSMKEAGAVLGLGTPFKMSQMIGLPKSGLIFIPIESNLDGGYPYYYNSKVTDGSLISGTTPIPSIVITQVFSSIYANQDKSVIIYPETPINVNEYNYMEIKYNNKIYAFNYQNLIIYAGFVPINSQTNIEFFEILRTNKGKRLEMEVTKIIKK